MEWLPTRPVSCPFCGEPIELLIDASAGDQEYVEDCPVCCQPMLVSVAGTDQGDLTVTATRENE